VRADHVPFQSDTGQLTQFLVVMTPRLDSPLGHDVRAPIIALVERYRRGGQVGAKPSFTLRLGGEAAAEKLVRSARVSVAPDVEDWVKADERQGF